MKKILSFTLFFVSLICVESNARQLCVDVEPLEAVAPKYPLIESPVGHSGYVVVEFVIDYRGNVLSPKVVDSHSEPSERFAKPFAKAAISAINKWKFKPRSIACEAEKKFIFELSE